MAAFGSSFGTIYANYFGDELGLPLPLPLPLPLTTAKNMNNKSKAVAKPVEFQNSILTIEKEIIKNKKGHTSTASKPAVRFHGKRALAFTPAFEGFQPFETYPCHH